MAEGRGPGAAPTDLLALGPLLSGLAGPRMRVEVVGETGSTSDDLRAAPLGPDRWVLRVADRQRRGRGRAGAAWFSPPGTAIHLSLATRLPLPAARWPRASLVVGLAVARTLRGLVSARVRCKWPNDLMLHVEGRWRKLGGLLCERVAPPGEAPRWIGGLGLNHSTPRAAFPPALRPHVASLSDASARLPPRVEVIAAIVEGLRRDLEAFVGDGGALDLDALRASLLFAGERVHLDFGDGAPPRVERLLGVAPSGGLLVADASAPAGLREVHPLQITGAETDPPWRAAPLLRPPGPGARLAGACAPPPRS